MKVAVYLLNHNGHAKMTCEAMAAGARACGEDVTVMPDTAYRDDPDFDVAVFWGFVQTLQNVMAGYKRVGKPAVYLDLGYFVRGEFYKVAVNARHPTRYFQQREHDSTRRDMFKLSLQPWRSKGNILIAGMGAKAAWAEKLEPVESWERKAIEQLKKHTDRPIVYRPKPSWGGAKPLPGVGYSDPRKPLQSVLGDTYAVVTHHSNVAVDGLVMGIPVFAWEGVARPMGLQDLSQIEAPLYPGDRDQWLNDVAYCQWSLPEMRAGMCWRYLKSEGLIP